MPDWKGTRVKVIVAANDEETEFEKILDTDTMSDIFDEFDPSKNVIVIIPADEEVG